MTLEDVLAVYAAAGPDAAIVRLHSGDPSIYGAIGEQIDWCVAHERDFEIVPGVSSLAAAAAAVGRELTQPGVAQSVVLTRLAGRTAASMPAGESVAAFAAHGTTMAVFLSAARPVELPPSCSPPAAATPPRRRPPSSCGRRGPTSRWSAPPSAASPTTWPRSATKTTVLVLVGPALAGAGGRSHLYSPGFAHMFRRRSRPGTTAGRPA